MVSVRLKQIMEQHIPVDALKQRAIDEFTYIIRETSKGYKRKTEKRINIIPH